jgi:hypothetical protein
VTSLLDEGVVARCGEQVPVLASYRHGGRDGYRSRDTGSGMRRSGHAIVTSRP